jgi:hypothetical protein
MKLAVRTLTPARVLPKACADSNFYRHVGRLEDTSIPSIGRCSSCGRVVGR